MGQAQVSESPMREKLFLSTRVQIRANKASAQGLQYIVWVGLIRIRSRFGPSSGRFSPKQAARVPSFGHMKSTPAPICSRAPGRPLPVRGKGSYHVPQPSGCTARDGMIKYHEVCASRFVSTYGQNHALRAHVWAKNGPTTTETRPNSD